MLRRAAIVFTVLFCLQAGVVLAADCSYDRGEAIQLFRDYVVPTIPDSSFVIAYCPQTMLNSGDIVVDGVTGTPLFTANVPTWLFYVDGSPLARFYHPTSLYFLEPAICTLVGPIDAEGWPRINGTSYYSGDDRYDLTDTAWVGHTYRTFFGDPVGSPMPSRETGIVPGATSVEDGCACMLIVDGMNTTESHHDVAGAQGAIDACHETVLTEPTAEQVCDALAAFAAADPPCDRLYFYFTGHGYSNSLIVNESDWSEITHERLAECLGATGIRPIATIIDACGQGLWPEAARNAGLVGTHITSSDGEPAWHTTEGNEGYWGMSESAGVYSYYLWICLNQGMTLEEAHACATDSLNAAFERILEYVNDHAQSDFDRDLARLRFRLERQEPQIEQVTEATADSTATTSVVPGDDVAGCIVFSGPQSTDTSRAVVMFIEGPPDPDCPEIVNPWLYIGGWYHNYYESSRVFSVAGGTGRYAINCISDDYPVRFGVTWPFADGEATPPDGPYYPAFSMGWPDGSGAEFNPSLGSGTGGGSLDLPLLSAPYSLCGIPRFIGGTYYWGVTASYSLVGSTGHPEIYVDGDITAPYSGDLFLRLYAESLSDPDAVPRETLRMILSVYHDGIPLVSSEVVFYNVGTSEQPEIPPVELTLPPFGAGNLTIELNSVVEGSELPGVLGLDAIVLAFNGPVSASCCVGMVGDANNSGDEMPTIGDISTMIDAKFISEDCEARIACFAEADINRSAEGEATCDDVTIGDISMLIDYLFITGPQEMTLPDCP